MTVVTPSIPTQTYAISHGTPALECFTKEVENGFTIQTLKARAILVGMRVSYYFDEFRVLSALCKYVHSDTPKRCLSVFRRNSETFLPWILNIYQSNLRAWCVFNGIYMS